MDERFLRAWFCREHTVLGRKLRAFSLAHRLSLEAVGSPLIESDKPFTMADLCLAVRICAAADPFRPLARPTWGERVHYWRGSLDPAWFRVQAQKFVAYLDDHSSAPKFWEPTDKTESRVCIPWILEVASALLRHTSLTEQEVWYMPLGRAFWYFTALSRQTGADLEVLTTEEEEFLDELAAGQGEEAAP